MVNFYLHSIKATGDIKDIDGSLKDFESILKSGAIYTRRALGLVGFGFNGTRFISLSDYDKRFDNIYKNDEKYHDYTTYEMYSTKAISVMIDKTKVKAITPTLIEPLDFSFGSMMRMFGAAHDLIQKRMTDLPDEVHVEGNIYEDAFSGVTIPSEEIINKISPDKLRVVYLKIRQLLERYKEEVGTQLGVYNLSDLKPMDSEEDVEEIIKRSL